MSTKVACRNWQATSVFIIQQIIFLLKINITNNGN